MCFSRVLAILWSFCDVYYNNSIKKKEKLSNGKYGRGRLVLHWVDARTDPNY